MMTVPSIAIAIIGAGQGGLAFLELLHQLPGVRIVGITDRDARAPGLRRARELHVPVTAQVESLLRHPEVTLILDVTGDPAMGPAMQAAKRPDVEILSGAATRLCWNLIQHQSKLQAELFQADKLAGFGSLAAGIAHDINNPLQLILGLAENLTDERDLAVVHEQAQDIVDAVKRTSGICRDLTGYVRRGDAGVERAVDLNVKMEEALKIARYAVGLQDIAVIRDYAPDATIVGNPDELLHVFVNLITNAVQAIQGRGTVTLRTAVGPDGEIIASVRDTGCGIPKESYAKIFEPLYTTKPPGKGTGLGLYNVQAVVSKMEGHICVESDVGVGTTIRLEFPPLLPTLPCAPV